METYEIHIYGVMVEGDNKKVKEEFEKFFKNYKGNIKYKTDNGIMVINGIIELDETQEEIPDLNPLMEQLKDIVWSGMVKVITEEGDITIYNIDLFEIVDTFSVN